MYAPSWQTEVSPTTSAVLIHVTTADLGAYRLQPPDFQWKSARRCRLPPRISSLLLSCSEVWILKWTWRRSPRRVESGGGDSRSQQSSRRTAVWTVSGEASVDKGMSIFTAQVSWEGFWSERSVWIQHTPGITLHLSDLRPHLHFYANSERISLFESIQLLNFL